VNLALLKGNRFNPWHLQGFTQLRGAPRVTAFRAESQIQCFFHERDDGSLGFAIERIHFDTQAGNPLTRARNVFLERYFNRTPRILPFHERLRGFDLIQTWELSTDWSAEAALAKKAFDIPLVSMVWDNIPFNMEASPERRAIKRRVADAADRILVYTERSRRALDMEGVPEDRVAMLSPGVDLDRFCPGTGDRATLGLDDDAFVILFVGWLFPRKGIDFLVMALRELLHDTSLKGLKPHLVMVGADLDQERVETLIRRLDISDACSFPGTFPYDRMPDIFRSADVFVLPSIAAPGWQEQFGMSLIEAMACGVPVVASRSGAIPEIAGDAAILVQPNDFLDLHEALKRVAQENDLRDELSAAGRARACEGYSLQAHAEALSGIYEEVLGAPLKAQEPQAPSDPPPQA
jgi:glycosyltransferase involved in cell wall biosynthesis